MASGQRVIKSNQSLAPFFGERMSFIRGLDPLGLQNTSDRTFSLLLPGLNNVTGRIRYYSFFCWLLDEYSKRVGSTDPNEQRTFIRKAEYMVALGSVFYAGDSDSIPGSSYAQKRVDNEDITQYDLETGIANADGSTDNTYWKFKWGSFGQYYLGSLRDIGIIINRDKDGPVYTRTNAKDDGLVSGEDLARVFDQNIPSAKKDLFFEWLRGDFITDHQLQELLPEFNLAEVRSESSEQQLLTELLIQKDYPLRFEEDPVTLRRESIYYLLRFVAAEPDQLNDKAFVYSAYDHKGMAEGRVATSQFGWYYYQFNEFWHYANTSILNGTLDYLSGEYGPNWVSLPRLIREVTDRVVEQFINEGLAASRDTPVSEVLTNIQANEYRYAKLIDQHESVDRVFAGFLLIYSTYLSNVEELPALQEFGKKHELAKDGEGPSYFLNEFRAKLPIPLASFIKDYLFKHIIYRHQYVALRKMGNGGLSTQKFIIEDHHIRYLNNFEPAYTGPRISNLISFLKDLHIISPDDQLTERGEQLMQKIARTDD